MGDRYPPLWSSTMACTAGEGSQAALRSNSARAALMPRRKAMLRVTQCAVRCAGVPKAVLNCCSIRAVVAMNC